MFNPNSAFPRQTTYVPYAGIRGIKDAINSPNFAPVPSSGYGAPPNLRGAYANIMNRAAHMAGGAPGGAARTMAISEGQGFTNQVYGKAQAAQAAEHQRRKSQLQGMGKPKKPGVDEVDEMGANVVSVKNTPISAPVTGIQRASGIVIPTSYPGSSARLSSRGSTFNEQLGGSVGLAQSRPARRNIPVNIN